MKVGDQVEIVQPVIRGVVSQRRFSPEDELELLVQWDEDGQPVSRWMSAAQLKLVEVPQ